MSGYYALNEIYDLQMGKTPSRDNQKYWINGNYDWISIADLTKYGEYTGESKEKITQTAIEESGIRVIPSHTLIMSFKLSIGKVAITSRDCFSNEAIMAFIDKGVEKIIPEYAYYLFLAQDWGKGINRAVMGATLNKATLSKYRVHIHDEGTQREIICNLNKITNAINLRKRQIEEIDNLVKSQFIEMFGEIGSDKNGWGIHPLAEYCDVNPKKGEDTRIRKGMEVSFVPMQSVSEQGDIDASAVRTYEEVQKGFTYFSEGDVLFAKITPCMENGKGAIARGLKNSVGFGSTEFHVLRPKAGVCNSEWIYAITSFPQFRQDAARKMTGSAGQRRVPASFLASYLVSCPPFELQERFARFVEQTDKSKIPFETEVAA